MPLVRAERVETVGKRRVGEGERAAVDGVEERVVARAVGVAAVAGDPAGGHRGVDGGAGSFPCAFGGLADFDGVVRGEARFPFGAGVGKEAAGEGGELFGGAFHEAHMSGSGLKPLAVDDHPLPAAVVLDFAAEVGELLRDH